MSERSTFSAWEQLEGLLNEPEKDAVAQSKIRVPGDAARRNDFDGTMSVPPP
jgi:hypothetical protein